MLFIIDMWLPQRKILLYVIIFIAASCHDANLLAPFVCTSERFYLLPKSVTSPFLESCLHGWRKLCGHWLCWQIVRAMQRSGSQNNWINVSQPFCFTKLTSSRRRILSWQIQRDIIIVIHWVTPLNGLRLNSMLNRIKL